MAAERDRPTVLITRPYPDAVVMANLLKAKGLAVLIAPMFDVVPLSYESDSLEAANVIALTSANGVRALATATSRRDYQIFAVGPATAEVARAKGFGEVFVAGGNVDLLAKLILDNGVEEAILHVGGHHQAGDLVTQLRAANLTAEKLALYKAEAVSHLPEDVVAHLQTNTLSWATFFSPRTAKLFLELIEKYRLQEALRYCRAVALSVTVASVLKDVQWQEIRVADEPFAKQIIDILTFEVT